MLKKELKKKHTFFCDFVEDEDNTDEINPEAILRESAQNFSIISTRLQKSSANSEQYVKFLQALIKEPIPAVGIYLKQLADLAHSLAERNFVMLLELSKDNFKAGYVMSSCLFLLQQKDLLTACGDRICSYIQDRDLAEASELGLSIVFIHAKGWLNENNLESLLDLAEQAEPFHIMDKLLELQKSRQFMHAQQLQQLLNEQLEASHVSSPTF